MEIFRDKSNPQEPTGKLDRPPEKMFENRKLIFTFFVIKYYRIRVTTYLWERDLVPLGRNSPSH